MRPHKTKKEKSSSDDDESHWVQAAIAVAGLGMSLWDRQQQKEANEDLKTQKGVQKQQTAQSKSFIGDAVQGELSYADEKFEDQKKMASEMMTSKLEGEMSKVRDAGASFSGSYRDENALGDVGQSIWQGYKGDMMSLGMAKDQDKLRGYSGLSAAADMDRQMEEIQAQINALG